MMNRLRRLIRPGQPAAPGPAASRDAGHEATGHESAALAASQPGPGGRVLAAVISIREPIIAILLAIAFMTSISGKPLDGLLMLIVAVCLAWDAGQRRWREEAEGAGEATGGPTVRAPARAMAPHRQRLLMLAGLAGGAVYAAVAGSFIRYSWPVTAAVIVLGAAVVLIGWHGPLRSRPDGKLPGLGTALWGVVFVAGCLWELVSLLQQPDLTTGSYAHPTISVLTDPVLSNWPGRSLVLAAWLGLGWFLVER